MYINLFATAGHGLTQHLDEYRELLKITGFLGDLLNVRRCECILPHLHIILALQLNIE
jgi:hypothetical protein